MSVLAFRQTLALVRAYQQRGEVERVMQRLEADIRMAVRRRHVIPECLDRSRVMPLPPLRKAQVIQFPVRAA